jgi:hypothetical protein
MLRKTLLTLLSLPLVAQGALAQRSVDFSQYDSPLYTQVVNRIRARVSARLGEGMNTRDRYFIIPFAYQNEDNDPEFSHSFITVIRVFADNKQPKLTPGLKKRTYRNREFEDFTVSWLPRDFMTNPHLCVFDGPGARVSAEKNKCPLSPGRNFTLAETLKLAVNDKSAVAMWGPYEINKAAFDLTVKRKRLLDGGTIKYRADDRLYRKDRVAINCFHAMAGLDKIFPNGGLFGTGFKMWGFNGTARVLIEYTERSRARKLLLEPVDVKKDRYGFVYAPTRNGSVPYTPTRNASAYRM